MTLYFITGNKGKFKEAQDIIPTIKQIDLDLLEIQELDPKKVIKEKLKEAMKQHSGQFFCEDTSVYVKELDENSILQDGVSSLSIQSTNPLTNSGF